MSNEIGKYTPLRTIVAYFSDANDKSEADQDKYWLLGLRALVDLNYEISAEPKTVRLLVTPNKTVPFPVDCLSWSKIGLLDNQGQVSTLKINNSLTTYRDNNPNRIESLTPNVNDSVAALSNANVFLNYYYMNDYYNLFGVSNGLVQYGECRVDDAHQLVVLPPDFAYNDIIFEYISSPQKDNDYKVETALQEAVIAFIEWKLKIAPRELYYAAATIARRRLSGKKVTLQGINQVIRESNGMKLRS